MSLGEKPRGTSEFYTELLRRGFAKTQEKEGGRRVMYINGLSLINADIIVDFDFLN